MSHKMVTDDGDEIEVYTAEEVQAQLTAKEAEFGKTKEQIERERDEARTALGQRTSEFSQFRKLSDDQLKKLDEKDRIIYENGLALEKITTERAEAEKKIHEQVVENAIRAKAGNDEKLFGKMKDMWSVIGIDAVTPEQIENKTKMIMGAISTTEPDLLAQVAGFSGGGWNNPAQEKKTDTAPSYADSPEGKAAANTLGLVLEIPKQ